ncbi:hypothetical protein CFP56_023606 [Quercus suber]|uniref:Uncharacterized protein n=1 Tax=Quercus suber TaxID=58331 RepID=A0AAW0K7Q0_QUESU
MYRCRCSSFDNKTAQISTIVTHAAIDLQLKLGPTTPPPKADAFDLRRWTVSLISHYRLTVSLSSHLNMANLLVFITQNLDGFCFKRYPLQLTRTQICRAQLGHPTTGYSHTKFLNAHEGSVKDSVIGEEFKYSRDSPSLEALEQQETWKGFNMILRKNMSIILKIFGQRGGSCQMILICFALRSCHRSSMCFVFNSVRIHL